MTKIKHVGFGVNGFQLRDPFSADAEIRPESETLEGKERLIEELTGELRRVTDHLASWVEYHPGECTAEIDAAIYCARSILSKADPAAAAA